MGQLCGRPNKYFQMTTGALSHVALAANNLTYVVLPPHNLDMDMPDPSILLSLF